MKTSFILSYFCLITLGAPAQFHQNTDSIRPYCIYDSYGSSFSIFIKKEVKEHRQAKHSEQLLILEGKAEMTIND